MNITFEDYACGCEAAELYLSQVVINFWQRCVDGAANLLASCITERSSLALAAITFYLFLALHQFSAIRRSYRFPTKLWYNDLLAVLGYIVATAFLPVYALHVRSPISANFQFADLGYLCIVFMAFTLFNEACRSRVIEYKGRMYRVEMIDVARLGRMCDREDADEVGFDEFWGVACGKETP